MTVNATSSQFSLLTSPYIVFIHASIPKITCVSELKQTKKVGVCYLSGKCRCMGCDVLWILGGVSESWVAVARGSRESLCSGYKTHYQ